MGAVGRYRLMSFPFEVGGGGGWWLGCGWGVVGTEGGGMGEGGLGMGKIKLSITPFFIIMIIQYHTIPYHTSVNNIKSVHLNCSHLLPPHLNFKPVIRCRCACLVYRGLGGWEGGGGGL